MGFSARERQALDSIEEGLARSDPWLVALLATFTRLVSDENMPAREEIPASSHGRFTCQALSFQHAAALMYVLMILAVLITGVVLSRGSGHRACPSLLAVPCAGPASAARSRPAAHERPASKAPEPGPHPAPG